MALPFAISPDNLPVLVPAPHVRCEILADGTKVFVPYGIRYLEFKLDRGLFEIGFMLNIRQFANLKSAEWFTIFALVRRLKFSDKLEFPDLRDTGTLHFVDGSNDRLVWATIRSHVIVTSSFTALDLHDTCMALGEPAVLREAIEQATHGCPNAEVEAIFERFVKFKSPHRTDISRALKTLPRLGIVREFISVDRRRRHAVMNMRMIANTRSGILRGMIEADDHLRRCSGSTIEYCEDIGTAEPPAKRKNATTSGKRRRLTREQYQARYNSEKEKRIAIERHAVASAKDCARYGYLTAEQDAGLQRMLDDAELPGHIRSELKRIFRTARTNQNNTLKFIEDTE